VRKIAKKNRKDGKDQKKKYIERDEKRGGPN
jgi:hypothetical protein